MADAPNLCDICPECLHGNVVKSNGNPLIPIILMHLDLKIYTETT